MRYVIVVIAIICCVACLGTAISKETDGTKKGFFAFMSFAYLVFGAIVLLKAGVF